MTIIKFLPFGGQSDKVPLISDEVYHGQTQPPPLYQPKWLETGDGGLPKAKNNNNDRDNSKSDICSSIQTCMLNLIEYTYVWASILLYLYTFKSFYDQHNEKQVILQLHQQDTENNASVTWKCYSSYANAESDMLFLPDSPPPCFKKMVIYMVNVNPVERVIGKAPQISTINKLDRFLLVLDLSVNITGIVDLESQRCYILQQLLYKSFEPHVSLCNTLFEMSTGCYSLDNINKILSNFYIARLAAFTNFFNYGMYMSKHCAGYPTFYLIKNIVIDYP